MRKIVLFIAVSLDGYIADRQGGVEWLETEMAEQSGEASGEGEDAYSEFIKNADTVLMGWNTYHQIVTELSPDEWVYQGLTSYVITHRELKPDENAIFTDIDPCALVKELKKQQGKDIWICGGANLVRQLVRADLIDEYNLSIIPVLLGSGIRLFGSETDKISLRLTHSHIRGQLAQLVYKRKP